MKKLLLLLFISMNLHAENTNCKATDFDEKYAPKAPNEVIYCYGQYELSYDFANKSAFWVGEHLGKGEKFIDHRKNSFHANMEIPEPSRTTPKDYKEPTYDQGHLAPSGDMVDDESQRESFLMSNMVPQLPELNRGIWKHLEDQLRDKSRTRDLQIITGPVYEVPYTFIGNRVPVPSATFKWVIETDTNNQYGYLIPNQKQFNSLESYLIPKVELELKIGFKLP